MEELFTSNEDTENKIEYRFSEIFDLIEIQKLQDLFSAATGVASIITEPDGTPITRGSGFCRLCSEIRKTEKGLKNCLISDSIIGSPKKDGPRIQSCLSGGLIDAGASIIVEGKHIANWLIGQVLDEDYEIEDLLSYADVIGVDRDVYRNRLMEVNRMSKQQFENVCNFLYLNAQQLSKYAIKNISLTHEINKKVMNELEIKKLNSELEIMVRQRTIQLEETNAELEETNALLEEEISERERAEEEIMKLNEELENKVIERTNQLQDMNAALEEEIAERLKIEEALMEQKETLQAIIDSLGAGIVMLDVEGKITFINEAWKDLFSYFDFDRNYYSKDNFYINNNTSFGTELFIRKMLTGINNKDKIYNRLKNLTLDRDSRYAVDMEQSSPVKRFLNLYSNPCVSYAGHTFGRVFVVRDVSHQKEVDRLKLELISTVSHELRTPMSSILGFSELLLTRKLSEERHKEYAGIINSEARRLTDLINDFLDIQSMESGKQVFNKQFHSVALIIEDSVKLFENAGDEHNIIYESNNKDVPQIYCDRDKILQVLSNLLSNAVKYSPKGGDICVDLTSKNGYVQVSVTDQGLGIPEGVKDKIFSKFYRIDNDDRRKIGGTGLGLAICKEIVRAHGGEIGVDSTYGQGSTFYFSIPLSGSMPDSAAADKESNDLDTVNNGQLLIVEDDAAMVKLIKEILKGERLEMHSTSSGEEAVRLAKEYDYRLFILDIALKGQLNGWDVVKELKSDYFTADTPIIISSVYENKKNISYTDISDYLVKPFEPEQMVKVVRKALNGNLNSKMMVNSDEKLKEEILYTLNSKGITVKSIEHSGNMLIITLDGEEGLLNE